MFGPEALHPEYMLEPKYLLCPAVGDLGIVGVSGFTVRVIDDHSLLYFGHAPASKEDGLAYVEAYRAAARAGDGFDHDFVTPDGTVLPRIRDGVVAGSEKLDSEKVPVVIEWPDQHMPPTGGNVLFPDGRVEFIELGDKFPMTELFIEALGLIDERRDTAQVKGII